MVKADTNIFTYDENIHPKISKSPSDEIFDSNSLVESVQKALIAGFVCAAVSAGIE